MSYYQTRHWQALRERCIIRDGGMCTVPGCGRRGTHVDHKDARPPGAPGPTKFDVLENLRLLCAGHDAQVKEKRRGDHRSRRQDGKFKLHGCGPDGRSLDPSHRWNQERSKP